MIGSKKNKNNNVCYILPLCKLSVLYLSMTAMGFMYIHSHKDIYIYICNIYRKLYIYSIFSHFVCQVSSMLLLVFCEDLYIFHIYFFWKLVCGSYYEFDLRYAYELYIDLRLNRWICKTEKCQADEAMHEIKVCRLMSNIWHLSSIIYLL